MFASRAQHKHVHSISWRTNETLQMRPICIHTSEWISYWYVCEWMVGARVWPWHFIRQASYETASRNLRFSKWIHVRRMKFAHSWKLRHTVQHWSHNGQIIKISCVRQFHEMRRSHVWPNGHSWNGCAIVLVHVWDPQSTFIRLLINYPYHRGQFRINVINGQIALS